MELIKENSKSVLEQWVNQFSDELYSWAFLKLPQRNCRGSGTRHFSAFHKIDSFEGKSQPKTWLFSILNNKVIDYYRLSARTTKKNFDRK
jgi:RNA polymerase sigma-70 factor (ECF subfamily)